MSGCVTTHTRVPPATHRSKILTCQKDPLQLSVPALIESRTNSSNTFDDLHRFIFQLAFNYTFAISVIDVSYPCRADQLLSRNALVLC